MASRLMSKIMKITGTDRKELRFPRTVLEPIRHVLGSQTPEVSFDDLLIHLGASPEQFEDPAFTVDGEQLYKLFKWIGNATQNRVSLKSWLSHFFCHQRWLDRHGCS
ncbi:hypothetical protein [Alcanivorax sp. 1008]|uniref:hypothetical protein n=1 Tax=Alcanivorax sp. 1008 TaxID=2816853 RepID=UPI001D9E5B95|nr:hypothetical protein [Alcanivorax sp. 1008]MCC1497840.1 hypothetical protein [Alcanivorax sp. 1008]